MEILIYIICAIAAYLLGNLQTAVVLSKLQYRSDIRKHGSGNAGATNMLRVFGIKSGIATFLIDILKAALAVGLAHLLVSWIVNPETAVLCGYIAGLFVVLGHNFPVFFNFKGGKGVACSLAVIFMVAPFPEATSALGAAIILIAVTQTISIASLIGMGVFTALVIILQPSNTYLIILSCMLYLLIIIRHLENIKRILLGKENKLTFKQ